MFYDLTHVSVVTVELASIPGQFVDDLSPLST